MNKLQVIGKFLDQPILVSKFQKSVPVILGIGAGGYLLHDAYHQPKQTRKKHAINTGIVLGTTIASAIAAPHIASAVTKRVLPDTLAIVKKKNNKIVDEFIKTTKLEDSTKTILEKSKNKILKIKEIKHLYEKLGEKTNGKNFLNKLIPDPQNVSAKDIFSEIGYLSVYGAVPVIGGILGGIAGDKITDKKHYKERIPDKIKEGSYQYLANIFMCNIGAGVALGILEKANIKSKAARAVGMTCGIITTGIIGGSKIANFIGEKFIDPLFTKKEKNKYDDILDISNKKEVVKPEKTKKERTPEILDISLHTDDIATVSLLSGLKWIEPALPIMYSVSGYRAGIGYRN